MSKQQQPDLTRRNFMSSSAQLAAGLTLAPGVVLYGVAQAKPDDQAVSDNVRWGMLIDSSKCASGCDDCVTACKGEHGWGETDGKSSESQAPQWIRKVTLRDKSTGHEQSLPMMCQHCENPPCADVCPTGASFKRADGIVLVDRHICIGCRYCMMACPYKARSFVHESLTDQKPHMPRGKGTVESCTMCVHKVDKGESTACAEACTKAGHNAILFGDLNNPNSEIAQTVAKYSTTQIRRDLGLNPGVRYRGI